MCNSKIDGTAWAFERCTAVQLDRSNFGSAAMVLKPDCNPMGVNPGKKRAEPEMNKLRLVAKIRFYLRLWISATSL
jgi:hypothetical protein